MLSVAKNVVSPSLPQAASAAGRPTPGAAENPPASGSRADCDVAIIGAGMAGLAAAKTLMTRGLTVRVLEADSQIGGRARALENGFSIPIDVGCSWLHDAPRNTLTPVVEGLGLKRYNTDYHPTARTRPPCRATTRTGRRCGNPWDMCGLPARSRRAPR